MDTLLTILYAGTLCAGAATSVLAWRFPSAKATMHVFAGCAVAAWCTLIATSISTGHIPLFGSFESVLICTAVVASATIFIGRTRPKPLQTSLLRGTATLTTVLLAILMFKTRILSNDYYMYTNAWASVFFFFRLISMGILCLAATLFALALVYSKSLPERDFFFFRGRMSLLIGASTYLLSELAGSIWCLIGWGDTWEWSTNFFLSNSLFLVLMLGCHTPFSWRKHPAGKILSGFVPSFLVVTFMISRQLMR